MKLFLLFLLFANMSIITQCTGAKREITSIYTDLSGNQCKTIKEDEETGSSVQECPGVGGFHLLVANDDARMSISMVSQYKKAHVMVYWNIMQRYLSSSV